MLKDGLNAEKSCNCSKQGPVLSDATKTMDQPNCEAETPSSSNGPTCGLESQTKMESETVPSSSGASKNYLFKIGIPLQLAPERPFTVGFHVLSFLSVVNLM